MQIKADKADSERGGGSVRRQMTLKTAFLKLIIVSIAQVVYICCAYSDAVDVLYLRQYARGRLKSPTMFLYIITFGTYRFAGIFSHFFSSQCWLDFAAIMAAEERRKQKEQIKILKQQVSLCVF